jgi:transposase-like protein
MGALFCAMKAKHADHWRLTAIEEYKRIKSAQKVADRLGIAPTTVRNWIRMFRLAENLVPETPREENLRQYLIQQNRIIEEKTNDPNVNLLGKPPVGRSALDQKRAKERENQNETRERYPFSISNYYRATRD